MGSDRSGRGGIDYADFQRAQRLARAEIPVAEIAAELGIERQTVLAIAAGRHQYQQPGAKYARCPLCGAMTTASAACACEVSSERSGAPEAILAALTRHTLAGPEAGEPPPRRTLPDKWLLGQITGRGTLGKTRLARAWWPGAVINPTLPPRDVVGLWLTGKAPGATLAAVAAACRIAGLTDNCLGRTIGELAAGELDRLRAACVMLTARRVAVLDPFLPLAEPAERARLARRLRGELDGGRLSPRAIVLVGPGGPLQAADWCFEVRADRVVQRRTEDLEHDRIREYRDRGRATGRCIDCSQPAAPGRVRCAFHLARQRASKARSRETHVQQRQAASG